MTENSAFVSASQALTNACRLRVWNTSSENAVAQRISCAPTAGKLAMPAEAQAISMKLRRLSGFLGCMSASGI
ncbi:hypothetical protein [Acidovorax sp. CCYZU-2555]|uniref:hypothetical protein n=1 Tax=Acidovorax sp. CCYZU-2555 TaxID=2835042 RepID=UPI0020C00178|nr:hypothetical protein [Acidovorax sp. CCYZU-2555]